MRSIALVLLIVLAVGCGGHPAGETKKDSLAKEPVSGHSPDSSGSRLTVAKISADTSEENPEPSLAEIYNECIAEYDHTVDIDSVFKMDGDVMEVRLHHYCLKDSTIRLPKVYLDIYKLDSFVTHNFETQLQVRRNGAVILEKIVRKKDFEPLLYGYLKSYAVLYSPNVNINKDTVVLGYSISIPLTDVGIGVRMLVDKEGKVSYRDH
ncbi:MAG TPA: hypothetical protein VHD83_24115 [Puia sp.]|nr:hypothetical protein [Puia sp.]